MPRTRPPFSRSLALLVVCLLLAALPAYAQDVDTYDKANPQLLTDADLVGKACLVMDERTGDILYEKNANVQTYPASTTKMMTALLALEHCDPQEIVTIPPESAKVPQDSSKTPVTPGEQMTMIDLLYGLMMKSGNDAAVAVAMHVSGSIEAFADLMNERARQIGCKNTHFVNPHGYHDENHMTTAYDLALIAREAMKNSYFRDIVSAKSYTMAATNQREKLKLATSNSMFVSSNPYYYPDLIGVKTGYYSKAGHCFVGAADKDGVEIISVTLKSTKEGKWADTMRLMDYADTRYQTYSFNDLYASAPVYASIEDAERRDQDSGLLMLTVVPGGSIGSYSVREMPEHFDEMIANFSKSLTVDYTADLKAPVREGDILGTITMNTAKGDLTGTLIASRDVFAEPAPFTLQSMLPDLAGSLDDHTVMIGGFAVLTLLVILIIVRIRSAVRGNRRRKELLRRRKAAYDRYRAQR